MGRADRLRVPLLLSLSALLAACSGGGAGEAARYFPLEQGRQWTYRVTTVFDDAAQTTVRETLRIDDRGSDPIDGNPAWRRRSDAGIDYWLRADASGIYRIASKSPLQPAPVADPESRYVLKLPLAVGTTWAAPTTAYVLHRTNEVPKEIRRTHKPFPMTYRLEALGETVSVPAGTFADCLRVSGLAHVRVYVDTLKDWRDIPLEATEWYCSKVGLVKHERREPSPTRFMRGGTVTLELTEIL